MAEIVWTPLRAGQGRSAARDSPAPLYLAPLYLAPLYLAPLYLAPLYLAPLYPVPPLL
ncbi:hypothetical protein ACFV4P_15640 [Kitasatospora sp. NPDC059795]|uniref:hypothetical protein n=1 Tax=Kitasatospora sp. NPDC059795 TaxID=3346949 RepID=UPI00364A1747